MKKTILKTIIVATLTSAANAQVYINWTQEGADVVATVTGTFDSTTRFFWDRNSSGDYAEASKGSFYAMSTNYDTYSLMQGGEAALMTTNIGLASSKTIDFGFTGRDMYIGGNTSKSVKNVVYDLSGEMRWNGKTLTDYGIYSGLVLHNPSANGDGGNVYFTTIPVPEPSSVVLLGLGALGLIVHRKR